MSALGNGSQFSEFKNAGALPTTLPNATNSGEVQANMQSKVVGGKKTKSAKKTAKKTKSAKKTKTNKRKSAKRASSKKSISSKLKSMGKKIMFWK